MHTRGLLDSLIEVERIFVGPLRRPVHRVVTGLKHFDGEEVLDECMNLVRSSVGQLVPVRDPATQVRHVALPWRRLRVITRVEERRPPPTFRTQQTLS